METDTPWRFTRFERETRYYELRLQQDLFGWVVVKVWGRKSSRLGQMRTTPCSSFLEASRLWDAGVRARQRRGYVPVDVERRMCVRRPCKSTEWRIDEWARL